MAISCEDREFVVASGLRVAQSPDGRVMELRDSPKLPQCAGSVGYNMEHDEAPEDKEIAELEDKLRKTRDRKQARDDRAETAIRSNMCFEQQQIVEEIRDPGRLRSIDEETLFIMKRMAVQDGSPGNNNMRFVFQDAYDETSCIASQRRTFEEACKGRFDQGAATSGPVKGD